MNNKICTRCKKRVAVVFLNKYENGKMEMEGLCLKCAKDVNIPGFNDMIKNMGISPEELDAIVDQFSELSIDDMNELFQQGGAMSMPLMHSIMGGDTDDDDDDDDGDSIDDVIRALDKIDRPDIKDISEDRGPDKRYELTLEGDYDDDSSIYEVSTLKKVDDDDDIAVTQKEKAEPTKSKKNPHPKRPKLKFLDTFCTNLNEKAAEGRMDPVIGRDNEIYRVIQILNRRTKNNACLLGEPGVGKTAIAEGIAQRIVSGNVPMRLADKELYLLDLTGLVAGTQFRGQFESRVKGLVDDVKKVGNALLFIDEVHTLVGAGDSEGSMNAANILKPALSRGEIQVIGATTFNEYRKHIEKDAALERRFQTVKVSEPNIEEATQVILGIKKYYETYHRVTISDDMAKRAVVLSERYINDRFLPDKAIDLLDEACSCAALANKDMEMYDSFYAEKVKLDAEIERMEKMTAPDFEKLAIKKSESAQLSEKLEKLAPTALYSPVTDDDFARVIELWTGIPASKVRETEGAKVAKLEELLSERIIGQENAVSLVSAAVRRSRIRLDKNKRPASFILVGPTGVGKTELVKVLSETLFNNIEPLIRMDMSEFMEKHSVSKVIGSPPGYVGYDEAGQLTEKVRRRPYSIVLLDEIEKAHPDVMNILLQIMDEGHIRDAQGRDVSFENVILMMTSNAGSEKQSSAVGFNRQPLEVASSKAMEGLRAFLRPEFLARVDEVVVFNPLTQDNYKDIASLMIADMTKALVEHDIKFSVAEETLAWIAEKSHGSKNGAREIRRVIRKNIEDPICMMIAEKGDEMPSLVTVVIEDDKAVLKTD